MDNFQVAIDATATAMDSAGSAMKENSSYMESLEAQTTQLKATFQDFANNVIDKELVSSALKGLNTALEVLNTPIGKTVTQWTLLTGVLTGGLTIYGQIAGKLISTAKAGLTFASAITGAGTAASGAAVGFGTLAATALPIAAILAGVAIAGWEVYKWYKETHKPLQEYTDEIQANTQQLEQNRDRLAEIEQMSWAEKTPEILNEYDALVQQNEELQRNIDLLEERRRNQAVRQARSGGQVQQGSTYSFDGLLWSTSSEEEAWDTLASVLGMAGASIDEVKEKAKELGYTLQENAIMVKANYLEYDQHLIKSLEDYQQKIKDGKDLTDEEIRDYQNLKTEAAKRVEGLKELNAQGETLYYTENKLIDVYDSLAITESVAKNEMVALNQEGVSALLEKYPQLKSAIEDVNGTSYLNVTALGEVKNATVEDKIAMYDLIAAQTVFNNSSLDVSGKIAQLAALAEQAGATAASIATVMGVSSSDFSRTVKGLVQTKQAKNEQEATQILLKRMYGDMLKTIPTGDNSTGGTSTTPTTTSTTKSATSKATDLALEEFKNLQKDLEHQKELGLIKEEKYYDKLEQLIKDYKAKATAHMKEYGTDVDTINRNMYQYEEDIYKGRAKLADELKEQQETATKESIENQKQMWQDYLDTLQSEKSKMDSVISYATEYASRQISEIEDELSAVQDEIDAVNARYDEKIDKLDETNDALEEEIEREKLLQDLATAKSKVAMVFKNGRFQYVQDADAISAAQAALDEFDKNKVLEEQKKFIESQRALDLQDLLNKQEALNQEKKQWEEYKDGWSSLSSEYEFQQNKLIAEQEYGIDIENSNWATRLDNLESFKQDYISKLDEIKAAQEALNNLTEQLNKPQNTTKPTTGGGGTMSASEMNDILFGGGSVGDDGLHLDTDKFYGVDYDDLPDTPSGAGTGQGPSASDIWENTPGWDLVGFANGTTSAPGGLAMVGENGPELRVLGQGDGVIPADITRNLWDWGKINPSNLASRAVSYMFNIDNLSLPNARDAVSLVDGLKQMAYQRAYKRA